MIVMFPKAIIKFQGEMIETYFRHYITSTINKNLLIISDLNLMVTSTTIFPI